jgi:hypothetical protein
MVSACTSTRCTKCGKKKRPVHEGTLLTADMELMDSEIIDAFWSPLESSKGRYGVQQTTSQAPSPISRIIKLDTVTTSRESEDPLVKNKKGKKAEQLAMRNKTTRWRRNLRTTRLLQNFARGMASALGTPVARGPSRGRRSPYYDDIELEDMTASRSIPPAVSSPRSRIRLCFFGMNPSFVPLSPEQYPITSDYHETLSSYHPTMPTGFRLRAR